MATKTKTENVLRKVQESVTRKGRHFEQCFSSASGEIVLKVLKEEFDKSILARGDATTIVVNAAQRDVIKYIEQMINYNEEHGNADQFE